MQCSAKSKQSGVQCKKPAVPGLGVCNIHGGKSLSGIASPALKTGRYSKHLPVRLMEKYDAARQDGNLLALRDDLALLDARMEDMLGRVDTGESGELWASLVASLAECQKCRLKLDSARRSGDAKKQTEAESSLTDALDAMQLLAQGGLSDYAAWSEIKSLLEQRRKISETEQKRLVAMQQMITASEALLLQAALLDIIKRNVTDRDILSIISRDIDALDAGRLSRGA